MRLHRFLILGICFVGLLTLTLSTRSTEKKGSKYAILIGVQDYDRDQLNDLGGLVNDVNALRKVLIEHCGFKSDNIHLMTLDEASKTKNFRMAPSSANIRRMIKSYVQLCDENDTLILAFAGHGIQFKNDSKNYFCPSDTKLEDRKTLIDLKQVYEDLTGCDARVKLLFVDACRNDPRTKEARSRPRIDLQGLNNPQRLKLPKGVAAFYSCQAGQESFEDRKTLGHGVFFHFVMEGL